jgi:hypothetical protein
MVKRSLRIVVLVSAGLACSEAYAGYLVSDATVTHVANTAGNTPALFVVQVSGGTGPCANGATIWITFPLSAAADADAYKRAYAAAMTALVTGMRVSIYNYANDNCDGASYIDLFY